MSSRSRLLHIEKTSEKLQAFLLDLSEKSNNIYIMLILLFFYSVIKNIKNNIESFIIVAVILYTEIIFPFLRR